MTPIFGDNVWVDILIGGSYYNLFCADSCVFKETKEMIEASTITSNIFKEFRPRKMSWTFDVAGITKIDNSDGQIAYLYLIDPSNAMQAQTIRATFKDYEGHSQQLGGIAFIQSSSLSAPVTDWAEASISFIGTGPYNIASVILPPVIPGTLVLSDWWNTVAGNSFIIGPSTGQTDGTSYTLQSTDSVKYVGVEGVQYDVVPGAPGNRQCQLDLTNHRIYFQWPFDGTQKVEVIWER